jgi:hypothetical protein
MNTKREKSLDQSTMDAILRDVYKYLFEEATLDNPARNQGLAREIMVKYGSGISMEGSVFALIGEYLQSQTSPIALTQALSKAHDLFQLAFDFVSARGETEAGYILLNIIVDAPSEDICAFAALTFASPRFVNEFAKRILEKRYKSIEGTSCKMAAALALLQCGEDRQIKALIRDGFLEDYFSTRTDTCLDDKALRRGISSLYSRKILGILIEDIATEGKGFSTPLNASPKTWKRKKYV